ncbi:MAG: DUF4956 domain-containing protein [Clostridia bacterium]|nr:DUF4956 domain-containing protein [Clostridia bacterium]MBQ2433191.1 DUF4956 domain-containing protein [Clostridia bacterium]MBQ5769973.1 DUF4956 domain-containing protein [Clostridia bacterium]
MKDKLYELLAHQTEISWESILLHILMSAILGYAIFISYAISHRGTIYSKKFNTSLMMLSILTGTVMTVIGNNVALSLGMVGALSIVRFRTAIKDSRDTMYIFWAVIVGICCGVGDYAVASIGSGVVFVMLLFMGAVKSDNRMLLIIRASASRQEDIQSLVFQFFNRKAIMRVRNTTETNVEFIYEISEKLLRKAEKSKDSITEELYYLGNIDYVNIVMQNDEVSN